MATHREDRTACSACPIPSDWWWKACSLRHSTLHGLIVSSDAFRPIRLAASSSQFGRHYRWDPPIQNQIPPTSVEMVISIVDGRCQDQTVTTAVVPACLSSSPLRLGSVCLSAFMNIYNVSVLLLYNPFLSPFFPLGLFRCAVSVWLFNKPCTRYHLHSWSSSCFFFYKTDTKAQPLLVFFLLSLLLMSLFASRICIATFSLSLVHPASPILGLSLHPPVVNGFPGDRESR